MSNRDRVVAAHRDAGALPQLAVGERSGVPVGSFDQTLAALLDRGTIAKGDGGYRLRDGSSDGGVIGQEESRTGTRIYAYCACCGRSHPRPDKANGETHDDVHNREVVAPRTGA